MSFSQDFYEENDCGAIIFLQDASLHQNLTKLSLLTSYSNSLLKYFRQDLSF